MSLVAHIGMHCLAASLTLRAASSANLMAVFASSPSSGPSWCTVETMSAEGKQQSVSDPHTAPWMGGGEGEGEGEHCM